MGHYRPQAMDDLVNIIGASSQAPAGLCTDVMNLQAKKRWVAIALSSTRAIGHS